MLYKPLQGRHGGIYWNVLQTYSAAEVAFDRFHRLLFKSGLMRKKPNESDLCFFLDNGANVFFKSGDKPQNLRSETLDGLILDECRQQRSETWKQILFPMLSRHKGWADFYSTPNGFDWFYDLYQMAKDVNPDGEWATFHAPSTECWWWDHAQIAQAKASMSQEEYAQEILAEFRELHQGSAYVNYSTANERETSPFVDSDGMLYSPYLPFVIGLDFNLSPMAWTIGQKRAHEWYWFDEVWLKKSHTQEAAKELALKILSYPGHRAQSPKIILAGDATAKAGQRAAAGQSDYAILCQILDAHGISWTNSTPDSNPGVRDRVNTVNAKLKSASGQVSMWVHPTNCPMLKRDLQRVVWKQGGSFTLDQTTNPELTHAADGIGYALHALEPISHSAGIGRMAVIRRI